MENKVLLKFQDFEVTENDVQRFIITMGQEGAQFNNEEGKKQIANEMMNQHLIYIDAKESGLDQDEEYKKELEVAKEQILRQYAMKKVLDEVEVSEDEIKEYYENNKSRFKKIHTFRASHILIDSEEKALQIREKISNNEESFEELAKANSTCPSSQSGGDLGLFSTGQMVPEFEKSCEELEIGEVSYPVKTQFGYHIIKLVEKNLARDDDYSSNKNDIKNILLGKKQQEAYVQKTNELQKKYKIESNI